jgi:hypothetical protein
VIGDPSRLRLTRKTAVLSRVLPTFALSCEENSVRWKWKSPLLDCLSFLYCESKKREVKTRSINECKQKRLFNMNR